MVSLNWCRNISTFQHFTGTWNSRDGIWEPMTSALWLLCWCITVWFHVQAVWTQWSLQRLWTVYTCQRDGDASTRQRLPPEGERDLLPVQRCQPYMFSSFQTGETFNSIYLFFFSVSRVQHAGTAWFPAIASTMSTGQSSVSTTGREEACSADTLLHCRATTSCLTRRWEEVSGLRLFWTVKQKCELNCWWIGEYFFLLHSPFFRGLNRVW